MAQQNVTTQWRCYTLFPVLPFDFMPFTHPTAYLLCGVKYLASCSCYQHDILLNFLCLVQVLYGKVSVHSYDKLDDNLTVFPIPPQFEPPIAPFQTVSLRRTVFRSSAEYTENSEPCLLTPVQDNLHQINAVEGPAAFLDILAPPYNADHGRDCNYYRILQTVEEGRTDEQQGDEKNEKVTWMLEIPEPEDFWCGPEPYPGPAVSVWLKNELQDLIHTQGMLWPSITKSLNCHRMGVTLLLPQYYVTFLILPHT